MNDRLLRVSAAADRFNITVPTAYKWIRSGRLRAVRFGRNLRITEKEIQDFLQRESHYKDSDESDGDSAA